jgi:hypothetical protein
VPALPEQEQVTVTWGEHVTSALKESAAILCARSFIALIVWFIAARMTALSIAPAIA